LFGASHKNLKNAGVCLEAAAKNKRKAKYATRSTLMLSTMPISKRVQRPVRPASNQPATPHSNCLLFYAYITLPFIEIYLEENQWLMLYKIKILLKFE
jgi:hypothetical protein